ncbi:MAG: 23S rRNA (uracil(1939)-C(5))-methyltransferase RlmD, partial [Polyangiales bacterium]
MDAAPRPYLPSGRKPRRDDELETTIERLDRDGSALASWGDYRVRFRREVPGRRVRAQVIRRRKHRLDARVLEVLSPAPHEVTPRCPHFGPCGGCRHQDLAYEAQLEELRRLAQETLAPLGVGEVPPVIGAEPAWQYRNKMELTFSPRRWIEAGEPEGVAEGFALGLH